ncbi:MAG TPA: GNAT family N-acetyltransferase [Acetobacteraceae bacterium]|nr:GNAT family N-acetyltransferase [Acetobacteraceae bacterium]
MTLPPGLAVTLSGVNDWQALGEQWREIEARADASFFQSWTWIGCLGPERYDNPVLLRARHDGRTVALGLFNRRRSWLFYTLWLHESGDPQLDSVFIEHNGLLIDAGLAAEGGADAVDALRAACLAEVRSGTLPGPRLGRRLVLSGVDTPHLRGAAATATVSRLTARVAPALDLTTLRHDGRRHIDVLSANTRAQVRRSLRAHAALGELAIRRASDSAEAHRFLDALGRLHQATWQQRGRAGAFANPHFVRFHHALIDRALPRGEVELWQITAGPVEVGYLYNFQHRGRVLAYQSGFDYAVGDHRAKPGLTCHHLAIERSLAEGRECYDFMAGDDRYKRSFSNTERTLFWVTAGPSTDPIRLAGGARGLAAALTPKCVKNWLFHV